MTNILVCFDGTGNEPEDAEQEKGKGGKLEDDNISNVLKLHLLAGGRLDNTATNVAGQHSLYYPGVGTRGSLFRRVLRQMFAVRAPQVIMDEAFADLEKIYTKADRLYLFGFSRGAAIARKFASHIAKNGLQTRSGRLNRHPVIQMLGVWDTVASFGKPNLKTRTRPLSDVVFENGTIAPNIRNAYHLVSVDENRLAFRPTLMNLHPKITEIWFAGVHSDIGGGYRMDGLSDITLEYMLDKARHHGLDFLTVDDIADEILIGMDQDGDRVEIGRDDIQVAPNHLEKIHYHDERWRIGALQRRTLAPRDVVVMRTDVASDQAPLIHHTVIKRIKEDPQYTPDSLVDVDHRVVEEDGSTRLFNGLQDHGE